MGNHVRQIIAVVRPHLAERVLETLKRAPLEALTVSEVKGYGRQKSYLDEYQETEFSEAFLPKVEITMWVDDSRYEETLEKVVAAARSGRIGDGKVFTLPVEVFQ
nr:P-II family nitrogen regulator [Stieleria sedimenti]